MSTPQALDPPAASTPERETQTDNVDVIFININASSDFSILRTGTEESVQHAITQVTKHVARGLYRVVSLNASEHSCVVVMSTEKSSDELMWKNGFPWDRDDDPQPEVVLH